MCGARARKRGCRGYIQLFKKKRKKKLQKKKKTSTARTKAGVRWDEDIHNVWRPGMQKIFPFYPIFAQNAKYKKHTEFFGKEWPNIRGLFVNFFFFEKWRMNNWQYNRGNYTTTIYQKKCHHRLPLEVELCSTRTSTIRRLQYCVMRRLQSG